MATYHLHHWRVVTLYDNPYLAPEVNPKCLAGFRDEHKRTVRTSPIAEVNGCEVTTESGSIYILEDMDPDYRDWLIDQGIDIDPDNPIVVKKGY